MAPAGPAYHVDWVYSNTSNVHVATHRDWFDNFTPFPTQFGSLYFATSNVKALGVGDVTLEVRNCHGVAARRKRGRKTTKLVLYNVLYAPDCVSNIVAGSAVPNYGFRTGGIAFGRLINANTGASGLLDHVKLFKLLLKGQAKGQTSLDPDVSYCINATWSAEERKRWTTFKTSPAPALVGPILVKMVASGRNESPYSAAEKDWLKKHFKGEFHFLRDHGLKIYNEDDRETGRRIVRGEMAEDALREENEDAYNDSDESDEFLADLEADPVR